MSDISKTSGVIARLTVQRGDLTEYPLAEKVRGGWQNGVSFYPDGEVTKVQELTVALATRAPVPGELNDVRDEFPETVAFIRENAAALGLPVQGEPGRVQHCWKDGDSGLETWCGVREIPHSPETVEEARVPVCATCHRLTLHHWSDSVKMLEAKVTELTARAVQGEPNDELELVDVVLTTADIEQLAHLLVQLPPATHKNSGATIRRLLQEMNIKEVGEVSASQVESNDDLEEMSAVEEALRQVLERQEAWHCNRVWEAWSVGTMTQDDFSLVTEDPVAVEELVQAATSAMARAAVPDAATETLNGLDVHDWAKIARAKEEAVEASVSAIERVRAIAKDGVWCDTKTSGDWAWALDHMAHKVLAALDVAPEPEWEGCDCHPTETAHLQAAYDELKAEHQELRKRHREGVKSLCSECLDNLAMDEFGLPVEGESKP